jgi:hypothetical protein
MTFYRQQISDPKGILWTTLPSPLVGQEESESESTWTQCSTLRNVILRLNTVINDVIKPS